MGRAFVLALVAKAEPSGEVREHEQTWTTRHSSTGSLGKLFRAGARSVAKR